MRLRGARRSGFLEQQDQRLLQLGRLEQVGTASALEGDLALAVDQVEPAGHAAVASADGVVDRVDEHRETEVEELAALLRDVDPFFVALRLRR